MIISSSNNMFLSYQHSQSDIKTHTYASKSNFYLNFGQIWENYLNSMLDNTVAYKYHVIGIISHI